MRGKDIIIILEQKETYLKAIDFVIRILDRNGSLFIVFDVNE